MSTSAEVAGFVPMQGEGARDETTNLDVSFAELHLWFAAFLPGFCKVAADEGTDMAAERGDWFPFAAVRGDSFAYLAVRHVPEAGAVEYRPHGGGR